MGQSMAAVSLIELLNELEARVGSNPRIKVFAVWVTVAKLLIIMGSFVGKTLILGVILGPIVSNCQRK